MEFSCEATQFSLRVRSRLLAMPGVERCCNERCVSIFHRAVHCTSNKLCNGKLGCASFFLSPTFFACSAGDVHDKQCHRVHTLSVFPCPDPLLFLRLSPRQSSCSYIPSFPSQLPAQGTSTPQRPACDDRRQRSRG